MLYVEQQAFSAAVFVLYLLPGAVLFTAISVGCVSAVLIGFQEGVAY